MTAARAVLPCSFAEFLGRFAKLTPVQEAAIPEIMAGHDVLMAAPTASGKTEAFAAPAAELALASPTKSAHALFVSPTRALANDLKRRLESRLDALGVPFGRYTGEHKERVRDALPAVVVATPEAWDSLLARRPKLLATTRLVVLDELHVLDGTPRGDQVRVLLHRLDHVTQRLVQRVAASATIERPDEVAGRYLRDARVVTAGEPRQIRARAFAGASVTSVAQHLDELARQGFRKVLAFCSRRADVESYGARLRGRSEFGDAVFVHHASLAQAERERVERRFLEAPAAVAFATMTLELGIDIGSVDYVLVLPPPPDVASLLQRIGRGGRRTDVIRAGYVVRHPGDEHVFRVALRAAARGQLHGPAYGLRPSVILQQALVLAGARGWVDAQRLAEAVPQALWDDLAPASPAELLAALAGAGLLERQAAGRLVLSPAREQLYSTGRVHGNIADEVTLDVVDRITGDIVGKLPQQAEHRLRLSGVGRRVAHLDRGRLLTDATDAGATPTFVPRGVPCCSLALARAVVEALGAAPSEVAQLAHANDTLLLHGLGTTGALLLGKLLGDHASWAPSPYVMRIPRPLEDLPRPTPEQVTSFVVQHERRLARLCAMGPYHRHLPQAARVRATLRASGIEAAATLLRTARLLPCAAEGAAEVAACLA